MKLGLGLYRALLNRETLRFARQAGVTHIVAHLPGHFARGQSKILTSEGEKQGAILSAEGAKQSAILRAEGQAQAIATVFQAVHENDPDPKLLAYQYLQTLPQLAQGPGNTFWVIPSEVTTALRSVASAFAGEASAAGPQPGRSAEDQAPRKLPVGSAEGPPAISAASTGDPVPELEAAEPSANGAPPAEAVPAPAAAAAEAVPAPAAAAAEAVPAPAAAAAEAMSAMLASAMPEVTFADPLGSVGPFTPGIPGPPEVPAATPDRDFSSHNGSESAG